MSEEKRSSKRLPVTHEIAPAMVRVENADYSATLKNESAEGMELLIEAQPPVGIGQRLRVQVYSGCYEMEVIRVEMSDAGMSLGLKRVSVLPELIPISELRRNHQAASSVFAALMSKRVLVLGGLVVLGLCLPSLGNWAATGRNPVAHLAGLSVSAPEQRVSTRMEETLNSLVSPVIFEKLQLREAQRHSIDLIFQDTSQSLGRLYEAKSSVPPEVFQQKSGQVVERAVQRVLCTMTEDQVLKWRKVLANSPDMRR